MSDSNVKSLTIYALRGSQYVAKVLAALEARKIKHYVSLVSPVESKRVEQLPSGGKLVPEMTVTLQDNSTTIVPDSEAILHWLDDNMDTKFFPSEEASTVSVRASNKVLTGSVWYFNWVEDDGYERSMKPLVLKMLPSWLPSFIASPLADMGAKKIRTNFHTKAMGALELNETEIEDKAKVRALLIEELKYFQSLFQTEDQEYLLPGEEPTAADFSVYCQVERLVGETGDAKISASIPDLKEEMAEELKKLWKWHDMMVEKYPIKFNGKREPKKGE